MTTTVTIQAHCSKDKEVRVKRSSVSYNDDKYSFIQDGESYTNHVYDDYVISVEEVLKNEI